MKALIETDSIGPLLHLHCAMAEPIENEKTLPKYDRVDRHLQVINFNLANYIQSTRSNINKTP